MGLLALLAVGPSNACTSDPSGSGPSTCGNGTLEESEACDDGNGTAGDGCSARCGVEEGFFCPEGAPGACSTICGDGRVRGGEACDDGNDSGADGCSKSCIVRRGWRCAAGDPSACTPICGDGVLVEAERCDDGNATSDDGCSSVCAPEEGFVCADGMSCEPICGDGLVRGLETCDDGNTRELDGCSPTCALSEVWTVLPGSEEPAARSAPGVVWTGDEMLIFAGGRENIFGDGAAYSPRRDAWRALGRIEAPAPRTLHSTVWTGSELLVFGGFTVQFVFPAALNDLFAYDPAQDRWREISSPGRPRARVWHTAVWTGSEMLVWGGSASTALSASSPLRDGGAFDPGSSAWRVLAQADAPSARFRHTAVWTGQEMIIWGGRSGDAASSVLDDGAAYDPMLDRWRVLSSTRAPSRRSEHVAVWTGAEMIVWGGAGPDGAPADGGARYDPVTDTWTPLGNVGAPPPAISASAVWSGSELFVFGGVPSVRVRYIPDVDRWADLAGSDPPSSRYDHAAVWTGTEMIVWGGANSAEYPNGSQLGDGARYHPNTEVWTPLPRSETPKPRSQHVSVWTGTEMIVWGGYTGSGVAVNSGGRLDRATSTWRQTSTSSAPAGAFDPAVAWTGREMIVFGGFYHEQWTPLSAPSARAGGGAYDPATDTWQRLPTRGAPSARGGARAVWTGSEVIVWGGLGSDLRPRQDGGRYDPNTRTWRPMTTVGAPPPRYYHEAVWTGTEMIVFGGQNRYTLEATVGGGARYDPAADRWTPLPETNLLSPRSFFSIVWMDGELLIWGGWAGPTQTAGGARWSASTNTWTALPTENEPGPRSGQTTLFTGREVLIWGGLLPGGSYVASGFLFDPRANEWKRLSTQGEPAPRFQHTAVWTGREMIVWGGKAATSIGDGAYFRR